MRWAGGVMRLAQRSALGLTVCLSVGAGCAGSRDGRASDEAAGEALTLAFAWPRDLAAEVEVERIRIQQDQRGETKRVIRARYRVRSEPQADALRVVSEDPRVTSIDGRAVSDSAAGGTERAKATLGPLAPTLRVDHDGRVLEVEGLEALRQQAVQAVARATPRVALQADEIARTAITPEKLSEHWVAAVQRWVGLEVQLGTTHELQLEDGRPGTLEVSQRVTCFPGAQESRCIRLRLASSREGDAGSAELRSTFLELLSQIGASPADASLAVETHEELEVRTEPERLVPHFVRMRREMRVDGGERGSARRVVQTEHVYRY